MSRLEIPKHEINTKDAIRKTLINGICRVVDEMPNGTMVDFKEIINHLGIDSLPYWNLKQQVIQEVRLRLSSILTCVGDTVIVDRNHIEREQIEAIHLKNQAMREIKGVMRQMEQQKKEITEESILEYLTQQDERNKIKYATWLKVF